MERIGSHTYTSHGFRLIPNLLAPEIQLANAEDGKYCAAKDRNLHNTQQELNHIVYRLHRADSGISSRDSLIGLFFFPPKSRLPIRFEYLIPHGYERKDCRHTACSCQQCGRPKVKLVRCRNHVNVIRRASSHGREWALRDSANKATSGVFLVGKFAWVC